MNGIGRGEEKKNNKDKLSVLTRETFGMTLLLFSAVAFLIAVTGRYIFGGIGVAITSFLVGLFGFFVYPLLILLMYISVSMVAGKKFLPVRLVVRATLLIAAVFLIVHTATAEHIFRGHGYGAYLSGCFSAASQSASAGTGGGIVFGIVAYPVRYLLSAPGAYIVYAILTLLACFSLLMLTPLKSKLKLPKGEGRREKEEARSEAKPEKGLAFEDLEPAPRAKMTAEQPSPASSPAYAQPYAMSAEPESAPPAAEDPYKRSREILFQSDPKTNYRTNLIYDRNSAFNRYQRTSNLARPADPPQPPQPQTYSDRFSGSAEAARDPMPKRVVTPEPEEDFNYPQTPSFRAQDVDPAANRDFYSRDVTSEFSSAPNVFDEPAEPQLPAEPEPERPAYRAPDPAPEIVPEEPADVPDPYVSRAEEEPAPLRRGFPETDGIPPLSARETPAPAREALDPEPVRGTDLRRDESFGRGRRSASELFDDDEIDEPAEEPEPEPIVRSRGERGLSRTLPLGGSAPAPAPAPAPEPKKHIYRKYVRPSTAQFRAYDDTANVSTEEIFRNSEIIVDTLRNFKVEAEVVRQKIGPQVTKYDIDIPKNIPVATVTKRDEEIAMRLRARDGVTMYVNNETGAISIEVPNAHRATVGIRSILQSEEYLNAKPGSLMFAIGKDVEGRCICGDIVKMKHLLVAGSTGSGKSVFLNAMLISLICRYSPEELRLILVDPKKVEFAVFEGLPHLMINEIINNAQKAVTAFNWAINEMERRYNLFEEKTHKGINVHNLDEYNAAVGEEERLPKIVIVVDELADLMSEVKKDIEDRIMRLSQKARAAGIHLVLATQRPSVNIITGVIKSNLPTRIAFRTIQEVDSRTILDESGAEKLLGLGDMLYRTEGMFNCLRVQGAFLSSQEVQAVIDDVKTNNEAYFDESVADYFNKSGSASEIGGGGDDGNFKVTEQYIRALAVVVKLGQASISLIQRKCGVGYNHAGKIIEWMEAMKYISAFEGSKARTVLLTKEEFEEKYGSLD